MLVAVSAHRSRAAGISRFMKQLSFLLGSYICTFIPQFHLVLLTATLSTWTFFEVNLLTFPATTDMYYFS